MTATYWMLVAGLGLVSALNPVPHQMSEESLRGALNAVTRKQRSLNANAQAYYGDLRKLQRQQVGPTDELDDVDGVDDGLAFIPSESIGQLETIGDGYQHLNNKQFGRNLMDYLDYLEYNPEQETPSQSLFRERERSGSRKRSGSIYKRRGYMILDPSQVRANELAKLFLDDNEGEQPEDEEYQRTLEIIADKLKNLGNYNNNNNVLVNGDDRLLLSELLNDEEREEEQDPRYAHIPMAERRNVNARYPLFNREYKTYRDVAKRFPVAKRSAKAMSNKKRQVTDPKVAQDLGGLFGTQPTNSLNHTHDHEHNHDHEHDHDHDHDHEHEHEHEHNREHEHEHNHDRNHEHETLKNKALKEIVLKANKTKERTIDVRKKSVDWSQYFGIDRRKKKAVYTGRPGSQEQDDEYLLQKYYEIMAEHLNNPADKEGGEKRGKFQQMDTKLRNMKNMMIEEAVQMGSKNSMDSQETKDEIMSRLAAAYSMEMLRRALSELNTGAGKEDQKANGQGQNNLTDDHPPVSARNNDKLDKRNRHSMDELRDAEEEIACPQMDIIERRCKATEALIGDFNQVLHVPCVIYHVCNYCDQEECLEKFALEAERACQEVEGTNWSRKHCVQSAMLLPRYPPSISQNALCAAEADSCFARLESSRHRYRGSVADALELASPLRLQLTSKR